MPTQQLAQGLTNADITVDAQGKLQPQMEAAEVRTVMRWKHLEQVKHWLSQQGQVSTLAKVQVLAITSRHNQHIPNCDSRW